MSADIRQELSPVQAQMLLRERAQQDIDDIKKLRESEAFSRYFIRRVNQRAQGHFEMFKNGTPEKVSKEEREILRRLTLEYEDLAQMMDRDFAEAVKRVGMVDLGIMPGMAGHG